MPYLKGTFFDVDDFVTAAAARWSGRIWLENHMTIETILGSGNTASVSGKFNAIIKTLSGEIIRFEGLAMVSLRRAADRWVIESFRVHP